MSDYNKYYNFEFGTVNGKNKINYPQILYDNGLSSLICCCCTPIARVVFIIFKRQFAHAVLFKRTRNIYCTFK